MKLCLFGGTFDPVHDGHVKIVEAATRLASYDQIMVMVGATPPHKERRCLMQLLRLEMVRLAFRHMPNVVVSDLEILQAGTSYTMQTVNAIKAQMPTAEITLLVGSDVLEGLPQWYQFATLKKAVDFLVVKRPDTSGKFDEKRYLQDLAKLRAIGVRITELAMHLTRQSSTAVRQEAVNDRASTGIMAVDQWLKAEHVFELEPYWQALNEEAWQWCEKTSVALYKTMRWQRLLHSIGTARLAVKLASLYNADTTKAAQAGMLHDVARHTDSRQLEALAKQVGFAAETIPENMWHGLAGAYLARHEHDIRDMEILGAIAYHTSGRPFMTPLETIIYVADALEYGRCYEGVDKIRQTAFQNLEETVIILAEAEKRRYGSNAYNEAVIKSVQLAQEAKEEVGLGK